MTEERCSPPREFEDLLQDASVRIVLLVLGNGQEQKRLAEIAPSLVNLPAELWRGLIHVKAPNDTLTWAQRRKWGWERKTKPLGLFLMERGLDSRTRCPIQSDCAEPPEDAVSPPRVQPKSLELQRGFASVETRDDQRLKEALDGLFAHAHQAWERKTGGDA